MSAPLGSAGSPEMLEDDGPVLDRAGNGDRAAQSAMMDHAIACANAGQVPIGVALGAAEVFARMAAADGETWYRRRLVGLLLWQAENLWSSGYHDRSRIYQVEAVELINGLADDGDELAASLLSQYAGAFSPEILKLAAELARNGGGIPDMGTVH